MLGDVQLAQYLDGALEAEALKQFEELASDDDGAMAQLVAQQRIHQALQALRLGEQAGDQAGSDHRQSGSDHRPSGSDRKMKRSIMEAACGKELGNAAAVSNFARLLMEPDFIAAAVCFLLVAVLAASLWVFAPH